MRTRQTTRKPKTTKLQNKAESVKGSKSSCHKGYIAIRAVGREGHKGVTKKKSERG